MKSLLPLLTILTLCYLVSFIGAEAAIQGLRDWYPALTKPSWNPPNWLFAPVWTILYGMMGVAAWWVWQQKGAKSLFLFGAQLLLNGAWSWIFFACQKPGIAAVEIVFLWFAILATLIQFWRIHRPAGALLIPYLCWVTFAAFLNFTIWKLNR